MYEQQMLAFSLHATSGNSRQLTATCYDIQAPFVSASS